MLKVNSNIINKLKSYCIYDSNCKVKIYDNYELKRRMDDNKSCFKKESKEIIERKKINKDRSNKLIKQFEISNNNFRFARKHRLILFFLSINDRTYEICSKIVKNSGIELQYVPINLRDFDMCYSAVCNYPPAIQFVPSMHLNEYLLLKIIDISALYIYLIPSYLLSKKICLEAVKKSPLCISFVPTEIITFEIANIIIDKGFPLLLRYIPYEIQTFELVSKAILKSYKAIMYVNKELLKNEKLWILALENCDTFFLQRLMFYLPSFLKILKKSKNINKLLIKKFPTRFKIQDIPKWMLSNNFIYEVAIFNPIILRQLELKYLRPSLISMICRSEDFGLIKFIDEKLLNVDYGILACENYGKAIQVFPKKIRNDILWGIICKSGINNYDNSVKCFKLPFLPIEIWYYIFSFII